jgi:hypothetical protein
MLSDMAEWSNALDLNSSESSYLISSEAQVRTLMSEYLFNIFLVE